MAGLLHKLIDKATAPAARRALQHKVARALSGGQYAFISSNCLGGRFSRLLDQPYRSPTVGLWFEPKDYLRFVDNLADNLKAELMQDADASALRGYPVARVNGIRINLQHYASFEEAARKWRERAQRVSPEDVFLLFTDRDGASAEDLRRFDALPYARKIVFTHKAYPDLASAIYVPGFEANGEVGDLYSQWHKLNAAISEERLKQIAAPNARGESASSYETLTAA